LYGIKNNLFLYWLERTDTKNNLKKNTVPPPPQIRVQDPAEGGGSRAQIRWRRPLRPDSAEGGGDGILDPTEGGGGDDTLDLVERGDGDDALDPVEVVVAARPHGRRGGEGGCQWAPLVVVVILVAIGAEVAHRRQPPPRHATIDHLRLARPSDATTTPSSR
jgi:hypothetical protein